MKQSTMLILAGAAVGVYILMNSKASAAPVGGKVVGAAPKVTFGSSVMKYFADPSSNVTQTNYYVANPNAQPWDIFKLSI